MTLLAAMNLGFGWGNGISPVILEIRHARAWAERSMGIQTSVDPSIVIEQSIERSLYMHSGAIASIDIEQSVEPSINIKAWVE